MFITCLYIKRFQFTYIYFFIFKCVLHVLLHIRIILCNYLRHGLRLIVPYPSGNSPVAQAHRPLPTFCWLDPWQSWWACASRGSFGWSLLGWIMWLYLLWCVIVVVINSSFLAGNCSLLFVQCQKMLKVLKLLKRVPVNWMCAKFLTGRSS